MDTSTIRTSDLYLAAFFKVAGVPFVKTETEGRRVFFVFEHMDTLRDLKQDFFSGKAKVSASLFVSEIKNMKALTNQGGE